MPSPARHRRDHPRETPERGRADRDEAAEPELPRARRQRVEGPVHRDVRHQDAGGEGHDDDDEEEGADPPVRPRPRGRQEHQHRPDQVELLLEAQRPEVEIRRWARHRREVVPGRHGEPDVGRGQGRGRAVEGHRRPVERRQERVGRDERDDQAGRGGGQDPPHATRVEVTDVDPAGPVVLPDQETRDQEPADQEEDVNADVAPGDPAEVGVVQDDEEDGDPAQALDVGAEPGARSRRSVRTGGGARNATAPTTIASGRSPAPHQGAHAASIGHPGQVAQYTEGPPHRGGSCRDAPAGDQPSMVPGAGSGSGDAGAGPVAGSSARNTAPPWSRLATPIRPS